MKIFAKQDFLDLTKIESNPVISIFLPTSRQSSDGYREDMIQLKNQLKEIKSKLQEIWNMEKKQIDKLLNPAHELLDNFEFWQHNSDMLTLYIYEDEMKSIRLPLSLEKASHFIGERPLTFPLIPAINGNGQFYILLLNLDKIHLYCATRDVIQEIILDSEEVALSYTAEEEIDENQAHLQGKGGVGNAGAMFHGHAGGSDEEKKVTILNYFHRMSSMLEPKLNQNPLPLFLAGVDYLIPLYRQASNYGNLQEGHISGSFSPKDQMEIHQNAWELASDLFRKDEDKRFQEFEAKKAERLAIDNDPDTLIKMALTGAVDTLFVNPNHKHLWGKFSPQDHKTTLFDTQKKGAHCLFDLASQKVIETGGKVFHAVPEDFPENQYIKGILRYPAN
ncbi:baeRF7 domain-containing protein [Algoriphagus hitonicola]|uniref:Uncharacterized protein n=1 Tax=Algoriphagus hitonicola TaxID=435880 RepID=A0A1I2UXD5_9BACT|nr:hypothetical protein [Algoriphagus hitonicola]SFG81670.1 hypothetical protein SAMN04487988_108179 [Algoriphagus hitonicola]